ncbi:MAG: hypothetical protein U5P41_16175 [Gammaproteobacteria bacterium]|nr:hypothetical protein [Gammaproteobacteria bacterium]
MHSADYTEHVAASCPGGPAIPRYVPDVMIRRSSYDIALLATSSAHETGGQRHER